MNTPIISVENLSKLYRLGEISATGIKAFTKRHFRKSQTVLNVADTSRDNIWAIRDVSFEVKQGEVLGIIGPNGAGKSTLLKILSRITDPTMGRAVLRGRVASLLEVGTGFHPDLTGRENIYLNGAILGMRKAEIARKFDEIVAFSEIDRFIDTPVKRYSSGMYVRLAFAVAAHLEPEILIVDEVLAVGDINFQKKCMGKMGDVVKHGRTILFVSHNMTAVLNLCSRAILMDHGRVMDVGKTAEVVSKYMVPDQRENMFCPNANKRSGDQRVKIVDFEVDPNPPRTGMPVKFVFHLLREATVPGNFYVDVAIGLYTEQAGPLFKIHSKQMGQDIAIPPGKSKVVVELQNMPLVQGRYSLNLCVKAGSQPLDWVRDGFVLSVSPGSFEDKSIYVEDGGYPIVVSSKWSVE